MIKGEKQYFLLTMQSIEVYCSTEVLIFAIANYCLELETAKMTSDM